MSFDVHGDLDIASFLITMLLITCYWFLFVWNTFSGDKIKTVSLEHLIYACVRYVPHDCFSASGL